MNNQRVWVEIVLLGTAIAVVLALLIATLGFAALALTDAGHARQVAASAAPQQRPETAQQLQQSGARLPPSGEVVMQDALAFTGRLVKEQAQILLKDPITKMTYQLDDALKAKPFVGQQVKVIGKLDLDSNLIYVDCIGPAL